MAAINQRIPNFLGGVSQQPDTIKFPGQVRTCDNFVPDVTFGLQKRPPGEFVGKLANANSTGYYYEILRDGDEKYLVQITPHKEWKISTTYAVGDTVTNDNGKVYVCDQTGASASSGSGPTGTGSDIADNAARWDYDANLSKWIRIWDLADGTEKTLTNSAGDSLFSYLVQNDTFQKYGLQSVQDYTIISNPQKRVSVAGVTASPLNGGSYAFARLDTIAYNTEYVLYTGGTAPTPNTYYRVTALSVTKNSGSPSGNTQTGNTWDDDDNDAPYAGLAQFSFSDSACENVEGHVTVNATAYVDKQRYNWDGGATGTIDNDGNTSGTVSGAGEDFIGYTQIYKTRYTAQVTLKDGGIIKTTSESTALAKSHALTIEGINYTVNVDAVEPVETYEGVSAIAFYKSPRNPDEGSLSMTKILQGLHTSINANVTNVTSELIGSGLYLHGSAAPTVNFLGGAVNEQMNIIGNTAQDISRLPSQCKQGYVAQIANDDNTDSDNYYVEFLADNGTQGSGKWEECVRPHNFTEDVSAAAMYNRLNGVITVTLSNHPYAVNDKVYIDFTSGNKSGENDVFTITSIATNTFTVNDPIATSTLPNSNCTISRDYMLKGLDPVTMPHALVNNRDNTFTFKKLDETTDTDNYWKYRDVGDSSTNPLPSFYGKKIQKIFFHRNRLGLIADEQVVMSRPGDYFNFFVVSAITTSDDNPIDITVSDIKPAFINHILPVQKGVMMFSDNGQFILFTESDVFSPKTARLKKVASYEADADIQPLDMGTSIMFTSKLSAHTRAFEATILDDDVPPKILEQTRVVPEFIPKDISISANSANLGMVTFARTNSKTLYHYKYYDSGERRDQSAWYTWTLTHLMHHMFYTEGCLYTVIKHMDDYMLNRHEFVADHENILRDINAGEDGLARDLPVCLDNATGVSAGNMTYSESTGKTTVPLPYTPSHLNEGLPYIVITSGSISSVPSDGTGSHLAVGLVIQAESVSTNAAVFNEKLTGSWVNGIVGYKYTSTLELPTYYPTLGENQYDINGDLRVSGMNFELGVASPMEFHLESIYSDIDDYIHEYTAIESDVEDTFGSAPVKVQQSIRIPIQRKNKKYNLTLKSIEAFPMSLISASWDGIYNQRRHVRR